MIEGLLIAIGFFAWGSHAVVPARLARSEEREQRLWALASLPLLLAGIIAALFRTSLRPDSAAAAFSQPLASSRLALVLALAASAAILADLLVLVGRRTLEPLGWRVAAAVGWCCLAIAAWSGEQIRLGTGPGVATGALALSAWARLVLGLAAGEVLAPGRRIWGVVAALSVPLYLLGLPVPVRGAMIRGGDLLTLIAAVLLLLLSRWVPHRLRRPAAAAGVFLAALLLARASELTASLPEGLPALPPLPVG